MNPVDREVERAEEDAISSRVPSRTSNDLSRRATASSSSSALAASASSASSSISAAVLQEIGMNRIPTQGDHLERNPTALSRIHTQRSQHSATVGRGPKSRDSRKPLPEFGDGKPYPPPLPEREEYVVEFDGEHDPLHAMNWPIKTK